jgi:hypothetical protein
LISREPTPLPQHPSTPYQNHKCLVWDLILAGDAIPAGGNKPETWIIRRMPQDYHVVIPRISARFQTSVDQPRPDPTPLSLRDDSHWRQSNGSDYTIVGFNRDGTEKNVSDDAVTFHANEGQHRFPTRAKGVYKVGFIRTTKRLLIDLAYCRSILWSLRADKQHALAASPRLHAVVRRSIWQGHSVSPLAV